MKLTDKVADLGWGFASWYTGTPKEQLMCKHPPFAREYRVKLLPEENATVGYEECMQCGKEWYPEEYKNGK